jgi:hypothetical protein
MRRASLSGLATGLWGLITFVILLPNVNQSILNMLSTLGYPHTYPALFFFYAMNYAILAAITAPILTYFSYYSHRIGSILGVSSLKRAGWTWFLLVVTSLALVPFVYQDAPSMIDSYEVAIAQGILPEYAFTPLGLNSIQAMTPILILWATVTLMLVSVEMQIKTRLNSLSYHGCLPL